MFIDVHYHVDRYVNNTGFELEQIERNRIFSISNSMDLSFYERNLELAGISA